MLFYISQKFQQIQGILLVLVQRTGTELHLIRPLGFSTDDKMLKRAGLDYWQRRKITYYDSIEEFYEKIKTVNSSI